MHKTLACLAALLVAGLAGCTKEPELPQVLFETSLGDFTVELWPDEAPVTVENFLRYVDEGHYDGLTFHRIAPGFVVQGGGYESDHTTLRPTNPPIVNEASVDVPNEKWTLSMARTNAPDSATSQFFVNLDDNAALDKNANSPGYAVFGKVIDGRDTIEAMLDVEPGQSFGAGGFWPAEPIVIFQATIIQGEALPPPGPAVIEADLITPGTWHVTHEQESIMAWARNTGETGTGIAWDLALPDGSLPDGWSLSFDDPTADVGPTGTTDHVLSMVRLAVPEGANGTYEMRLVTGESTTDVTIEVDLVDDRISLEGDSIIAGYRGTCVEDGNEFDAGDFPLTLGGGRAIPGFDLGLVGLGLGEEATLMIPHGHAYGKDGGPCGGLDNADLQFEVELKEFDE